MNKSNLKPLLAVIALSQPFGAALLGDDSGKPDLSVQGLRCEYLSDPSGIDVQKPRLSWVLNSAANARGQSAYRVLVASSQEFLRKDQGDLWDSSRVVSTQSTWIEYGGKTLASGQRAYSHTAPNYQNQGGGGPMWGGMVVTLPWQMYLHYGDRHLLEANYPMIQKWLGSWLQRRRAIFCLTTRATR